jgi:hypothetical protein
MPGDQAARLEQQARDQGIAYAPAAWDALAGWAQQLGVELPTTAATVD